MEVDQSEAYIRRTLCLGAIGKAADVMCMTWNAVKLGRTEARSNAPFECPRVYVTQSQSLPHLIKILIIPDSWIKENSAFR